MSSAVNRGPSAAWPTKPWEKQQQQRAGADSNDDKLPTSHGVCPVPGTGGATSVAAVTSVAATSGPLPGSTLHVMAPYGPTGYGTGMGSTYGTGLGSTYAGGMNSYGTGGYAGGGGYGGYTGMSRMGYGGPMSGGGNMDPNGGGMGWLSSFNQIVSSIGQITELLGMNAEALNFCIGSSVHFLERIGAMCAGIAAMLAPRPVFPPGHPRHGEPPVTEEEERSRRRRVRIFQFILSMATLALLYKGLRWLRGKTLLKKLLVASPSRSVNRDLEQIFQRTVGVQRL
uniref:Peroxin-13 n=1 Tax=Peronospora matthiolae TaxID=2874970 RepID=A0AAV1U896_9STRA